MNTLKTPPNVKSRPMYTTRGSDGCVPLRRFRRCLKVVGEPA